jgi:tetratricopeptide (TPR) repeat protein
MINIPLGLKNVINSQNCVLFVGAGIGIHLKNSNGDTAPNGGQLCELMCKNFKIPYENHFSLNQISELVEIDYGRKELESFVSSQLSSLTPDDTFRWISTIRWRSIFTTNYDNCIERAYQLNPSSPQKPITFSITSDTKTINNLIDIPIYHLHGYLFSGEEHNLIITKTDYAKFRKRRRMIFEILKSEIANASILYVGYSHKDPNWDILIEEIIEDFLPTSLPTSYKIDPFIDDIDEKILRNKNIQIVKCTFQEFVETSKALCIGENSNKTLYDGLKKNIPNDFLEIFENSPTSVVRLLSSWDYINQTDFNIQPNLAQFLKGDYPNWSLISEKYYFERDIQEDLYDAVLDFSTYSKSKTKSIAVLGSAGYGISTFLRTIAVKIIEDKLGSVFFLKPEAELIEGDIQFASTLFENVFFIIDNASRYASTLEKILHFLRESNIRAMFIIGGRNNEWHQCPNRPKLQEYPIGPLSDSEIDKLLSFLSKNSALSKLENLPYEMQFSIIKERHKKELLVVMSEATESTNFDAIIESEYRGIIGEKAKLAYLYVCGFYQHGAYVRNDLLSELINISINDFYEMLHIPTEGIIITECIDGNKFIYGARARHHKIAAIVWERCADAEQKETIIQNILNSLNLNYGSDSRAFEQFIRSDKIVDCIRSLEGRINFFENACKMDPNSPYICQHYSRMLSRSNHNSLALQQIESAIEKDKNIRILYHTKGKILSQLAITQTNIDIARKYLSQAEGCFNKGISLNKHDDYGYESIASLYFEWSQKIAQKDKQESIDYLSKAEEKISLGLQNVRNRESLWLLSSKIASHFGKTPEAITILESAIKEHQGVIISRFVLARAYRNEKKPEKALEILEPILNLNTDDFRPLIEYALALIESGSTYKKAINILELGILYGFSDANFISIYGGMLFLDGNFEKSDEVFQRSINNSIPGDELYKINYRPHNINKPEEQMKIEGEVVKILPGSSIIKPDCYPQIKCSASKYKGELLSRGMKVRFVIAFQARGPIALYPEKI